MDPDRTEVYVEGPRDRCFLRWLVGSRAKKSARVVEISFVEIDVPGGGNRARVLAFASMVGGICSTIHCFADADFDRVLCRPAAPSVVLTDGRDLESYLLRQDCLEKLCALALTADVDCGSALVSISAAGRLLGELRLASEIEGWKLPFQDARLEKYIVATRQGVEVEVDPYLRSLLQNARVSLKQKPAFEDAVKRVQQQYAAQADRQVIHGKDLMVLIDAFARAHGATVRTAESAYWSTFERAMVVAYPNLSMVLGYLV